jgi:hypothetical protein
VEQGRWQYRSESWSEGFCKDRNDSQWERIYVKGKGGKRKEEIKRGKERNLKGKVRKEEKKKRSPPPTVKIIVSVAW